MNCLEKLKKLDEKKKLILIIVFAAILRVLFIWNRNLGNDESYTVDQISHGLAHFWEVYFTDASPPVYYFLTYVVNDLFGFISVYFLAIIFGLASIVVLYLIAKEYFNKNTAILAAIVISVSTMHVLYSQHIRAYSFMQFFVLLGLYIAILYLKKPDKKYLLALAVPFALATFSYWLAAVPFIIIYLYIFVKQVREKARRKEIPYTIASVASAPVLFALFYNMFAHHVSREIPVYDIPLALNIPYFFYKHFAGVDLSSSIEMFPLAIVLGVILCLLFAHGLWISFKSKKNLISYVIFGSIIVYYVLYLRVSSVIYFKHMSAMMPLIFIFPALSLAQILKRDRKKFWALLTLIILLSLATLGFYYYVITTFFPWVPIIAH